MVWCGVVWCAVVWCGVVWCGVVWCGVVWCGVVWCGVAWCVMLRCVVWCWLCSQLSRDQLPPADQVFKLSKRWMGHTDPLFFLLAAVTETANETTKSHVTRRIKHILQHGGHWTKGQSAVSFCVQ